MKIKTAITAIVLAFTATAAIAQDVYVRGHYRSDGTYVRPHVRSAPDGDRSNNYGPSRTSPSYSPYSSYTPPSTRNADRDRSSNMYDNDDDNDGISDNSDRSQYGGSNSYSSPWGSR